MKWLAVLNPCAGHRTRRLLENIGTELKERIGADWTWTNGAGTADEIVRENYHYDGFIGVGGDGTLSEVVNGLDPALHSLGFIPAGSGNGLAHDLKLLDTTQAIHALHKPRFAFLDWILVRFRQNKTWQERRMISTSALGYIAGATAISNHPCKRLGNWFYALSAILQSFYQDKFQARVRFDFQPWEDRTVTNLTIQNTQHIGQFRLIPEARLDDGMLNVLVGRLYPLGQLLEDLGTLTQTYFYEPSQHAQAHQFEIELPVPATLMVDGDLYDNVDAVCYQVVNRNLRCCIGEQANLATSIVQEAPTEIFFPAERSNRAPRTIAANPSNLSMSGNGCSGKLSPRQ